MKAASLPSRHLFARALRKTFELFFPVLARGWMPLLILHVASEGISQIFGFATDYVQKTGREDISFIAMVAGSELIFSLILSAAWILLVIEIAEGVVSKENRLTSFAKVSGNFNQLMIEQVRAMASILWRAPLLILPAMAQYIRLAFVPFVVLLDSNYQAGQIDALKQSGALSRGQFWFLTALIFLAVSTPWFASHLAQGGSGQWIWENPLGVSLGWVLTLFINCLSSVFLFAVFRVIVPSSHDNTPLQQKRN